MRRPAPLLLACAPLAVLACSLVGGLLGEQTGEAIGGEGAPPIALPTGATAASAATPYAAAGPPSPPGTGVPAAVDTSDWPYLLIDPGVGGPCGVLYPPESVLEPIDAATTRIRLPFAPGTTLREKLLLIHAGSAGTCAGAYGPPAGPIETVRLGDGTFTRYEGSDAGAGSYWQWVAYVTEEQGSCVAFTFTLDSANPMHFDPPLPLFDYASESTVFDAILSTFTWGAY